MPKLKSCASLSNSSKSSSELLKISENEFIIEFVIILIFQLIIIILSIYKLYKHSKYDPNYLKHKNNKQLVLILSICQFSSFLFIAIGFFVRSILPKINSLTNNFYLCSLLR